MQIDKPQHRWQLSFEGDWPTSVAFLGDSTHLAAGDRGGRIFVWNLNQASPKPETASSGKAKPAKEKTNAAAKTKSKPSGDSKDPADLAPVRQLRGHSNAVTRLVNVPHSRTLISASLDRTLRVWEGDASATGTATVVLDRRSREQKARSQPKDKKQAILDAPGIPVETVEAAHTLTAHKAWINALGISADGKRLISGDDDCRTIVWDLATRRPISEWRGHDRVWIRSAALSTDGKTAFTCEFAGRRSSFDVPAAQARLWDAESGKQKLDLLKVWTPKVKDKNRDDSYGYMQVWSKLLKRGLISADFSADGKLLAVGQAGETDTGKVHLIDVVGGKIVRTVSGHRYGVCDVRFSADSRYIVSSGRDTTVRICQVSDGKEVAALGKSRGGQFKDWLHAVAISPDQKLLAAADISGRIQVWQLKTT